MTTVDELLDFRAFAITYQAKLRSKLKRVSDEGGMQDLRAEIETAALLLREERFTLEYEKYAALKQRGPDFTITFKTHTLFNVEVRRIRRVEWDEEHAEAGTNKLIAVLCEKLGQLPPSIVNLLWLTSEREISPDDINRAVTTLRQLADSKQNEFFARRGFINAVDFYKQFQRLSGISLHQPEVNVVWLNPVARHKTPAEIGEAVVRLGKE